MQEVTTGMKEKGIYNIKLIDGEDWRRKIKLYAKKDLKTLVFYTLKN